ncbi:MAG: nickel-responsive transcriptional regulator NikR [Planctomycetaceae bacterium]|jgi:CopG family nickel-responsive transcriptional regulator|nr:nickel-responsive transcriptional regulator NikR [Planctomycetaceae bacterium]
MSCLTRISISIEDDIIRRFDTISEQQGLPTRSEAIKQLISSALVQYEWECGDIVAGVITIIYDHHKTPLVQRLLETQHNFNDIVICSQHAHLDHNNCMENIIVKGEVEKVKNFHKMILAIKGMKHTALSMSTTGSNKDNNLQTD